MEKRQSDTKQHEFRDVQTELCQSDGVQRMNYSL